MSVQVAGNGSAARVEQREGAAADPAARPQNTHRALDGPRAVSAEPGFQGAREPSLRAGARSAGPTGRECPGASHFLWGLNRFCVFAFRSSLAGPRKSRRDRPTPNPGESHFNPPNAEIRPRPKAQNILQQKILYLPEYHAGLCCLRCLFGPPFGAWSFNEHATPVRNRQGLFLLPSGRRKIQIIVFRRIIDPVARSSSIGMSITNFMQGEIRCGRRQAHTQCRFGT